MIDLSNVIALALGSDDVLQIQDAVGTVLWQKTIYYNVNISAGSNGTVSVNGVSGNYSQSVPSGTVLAIEGTGNTGYNFNEWSDGNTDNPRTITVTGDLTLTASFASAALPNYFYVEDISGTDNTLSVTKLEDNAPTIEVFKSTDGTNWSSMGTTSTTGITATIPANGKLYLKATADCWGYRYFRGNIITASGNHNVGGNIMSLIYGSSFIDKTDFPEGTSYNFRDLFTGNTHLISAANLILPPTVTNDCYTYTFGDCTSLTQAPAILPATTLVERCYWDMFGNCTSLTQAPTLPATTLATECYHHLFGGCTSLAKVITYATDISAADCLTDWLDSVSSTGTFYNMACTTYPSGSRGIPAGWTELHTLNNTINVTIHNVDLSVSGATYQIDGGTEQPINETGDGITEFTIPVTATDLTINGSRMTIEATGVCGYTSGRTMSVSKMSDNVDIDITSMM
jgi:hypothetical protein